ncbi:hypothetical protein R5R35_014744 [Gryllus longicercus]|uniref:Major facilitator superfamily (MFS) profile domain-containing protein n=1 Tax=Gryllus longicercus TaxID=2509291 RepID=A0AAN9VUI8_9ORTH
MTEEGSTRLQFIAAFSATIAYLIGGTFLGWPSPSIPKLLAADSHIALTADEGSWVAALASFGMLFAPLPTGYLVDVLGRKPTLAFTALPFLASWLMVTFARSAAELYASRVLAGLALGMAFTVGPVYMGEIAEDRVRGAVGTVFQVMINLGTLFEYSVGPYVSYAHLGMASMVFPVLFLLSFVWMPETPYFLLSKNRREAAEKSLMRLRGKKTPESVKEELDLMQMAVEMQAKEKGSFRDLIGSWGNMKALMIVLGLMVTQHFSGIIPMLSFVTIIFLKSGSSIDANISAIIFGVVQLVISIVSSGLVDKAGRRPLLLVSAAGCAISLTVEGLYFYLAQHYIEYTASIDWLPITCLLVYIITYTLGLGPLPWAIAGEVFPNNVKGVAVAVVSMVNAICGFVATKLFQVIGDRKGSFLAFWIFAGCSVVGTVFIALFLPETKGKSLLQITEEMNARAPVHLNKNKADENSNEKHVTRF